MTDVLHGNCLCGAIKLSVTPARRSMGACHCDMCRRWTSSMLLVFPAGPDLEVEGPVQTFVSSDWAERAFCNVCGSSLWYKITAPGPMHNQIQLAAGLFNLPADMPLELELYIDKKPQAYAFAGARKQMTADEVTTAFILPLQKSDRP